MTPARVATHMQRALMALFSLVALASVLAGCGGGGTPLFGPGSELSQIAHDINPTPTPTGTPILGTVVPIAQATGPSTYPLQSSAGYVGTITFGTPIGIASGVSIILASGVPAAPSPQATERNPQTAGAPTPLASWEMGFNGWSGSINGSFSVLPSVTLALLNPLNLVVEIIDGTAVNSTPAVLYPQTVTVNGFVTFASPSQNQPTSFLYTHVYWIELVSNSALPVPTPAPSGT